MGIRIHGLGREFRGKKVFHASFLEAPTHGLVALRGPNGSGKTTVLRTLSTLIAPTFGEAWIDGASILSDPRRVRERIGYVPATDGSFFKRLTGEENLLLFGGLRGLPPGEIRRSARLWSEVLPLDEALRIPFAHASAGMRQALSVCRALLHDPPVVLLDEPTRSLDPEAAARVRASLKILAERKTLLLVTHRQEEWEMARAVWEIRGGALGEASGASFRETAEVHRREER